MMQKKDDAYSSDAVGSVMTKLVPTISDRKKIGDIEILLSKKAENFETINYVYVLNKNKHLKGIISLKEVFRLQKKTNVSEIMTTDIVSVRPHTHKERAAILALHNNIKAIPVLDRNEVFVGVVTSDMVLQILHSEAVEDLLRLGGLPQSRASDDIFSLSVLTSIKHRLPWLLLGLVGGIGAAGIVSSFEKILSQNLILAAFIPLIVYMAGAIGTQMEAFIIRDLAINLKFNFVKYFLRQASIVLLVGLWISLVLYGISWGLYGNSAISLVLSVALYGAILSSLVTGLIVPYLFGKLKLDPANGSGPIGTIIQDILSVFIYLSIASYIL